MVFPVLNCPYYTLSTARLSGVETHCVVGVQLEFVTGGVELLKAVLHGYAGGMIFMK